MIIFLLIILSTVIISTNNVKAQSLTIVKGYIYIDEVITGADGVSLVFPDEIKFASVYDDGRYIVIFENEESGTTGTFLVNYNNVEYTPTETVTIEDGIYVYSIDLHIETESDSQPVDDPTNIQPKSLAGGPYYEIVNDTVYFNGSASYDQDGKIIQYRWDFGDGETSDNQNPSHVYSTIGNYKVILTVTDEKGKTDLDITYAYITETPNTPPNKPVLNGTLKGTVKKVYNYTIYSTDIENNTIKYVIDWGDETNTTNTHLLDNATLFNTNHSWNNPGVYKLRAYAIDENNAISETTEKNVFIDTIYCKNIGYLTDYTNDGFYDLFYSNISGVETPVDFVSNLYLIDENNNGTFDYEYNVGTDTLNEYSDVKAEKSTNIYDKIIPLTPYLIFGIAIIAILIIVVLGLKKLKKSKPKKEKKEKNTKKKGKKRKEKADDKTERKKQKKKKESKEEAKDEDDELKKIRDKIDKL